MDVVSSWTGARADAQRHTDNHLNGASPPQHVARRQGDRSSDQREERLPMTEHIMGEVPREAGGD